MRNSLDKEELHTTVKNIIIDRIDALTAQLEELRSAVQNDTKSTAGDKHETSRAMAQLEQEQLGKQLAKTEKLLDMLNRINPSNTSEIICLGSLSVTTNGCYYLSVAIGSLSFSGKTIFCLSPASPFGKLLIGKKTEDELEWLGNKIRIQEVF